MRNEKNTGKVNLSLRLATIASLVTPGSRLVDVGCDHGFLSIWLVQQGIVPSAIASDVRPGPLSRAVEHVREMGLESRIETRLSDGLKAIEPGEGDTLVIAGMGGPLMERLLSENKPTRDSFKEFILQPQSDIPHFRRYLLDEGLTIIDERIVEEDGKFYPMMKAVSSLGKDVQPDIMHDVWKATPLDIASDMSDVTALDMTLYRNNATGLDITPDMSKVTGLDIAPDMSKDATLSMARDIEKDNESDSVTGWSAVELKFGRYLLRSDDSVMDRFLAREQEILNKVREQLRMGDGEHAEQRRREIKEEQRLLDEALSLRLHNLAAPTRKIPKPQ